LDTADREADEQRQEVGMAELFHRRPVLLRWWRTEQSEFSLEGLARAAG
jgi:hypothetical protein